MTTPAGTSPAILPELVKIVPDLLWIVLAAVVFALLYPRLKKLKVGELEVELDAAREELTAALEMRRTATAERLAGYVASVIRRAERAVPALRGALVLWVDDDLESIAGEVRTLRRLGIDVHTLSSSAAALGALGHGRYDVVVTDMARGGSDREGLDFAARARVVRPRVEVIVYLLHLDPARGVPPGIFGLTNRPDELCHLVLDVLERKRS